MGTGVGLRSGAPKNQKLIAPNLPSIDREKVSKIVDICNVSADEAARILDLSHMDLDMAINRALSGTEENKWFEVGKKQRNHGPGPYRTRGQRHGRGRDQDRDRGGRERDRPSGPSGEHNTSGYRERTSRSNGHQNSRDSHANGGQKSGDNQTSSRAYPNASKRGADRGDYRNAAAEPNKGGAAAAPVAHDAAAPLAHRPAPPEKQEPSGPVAADLNWNDPQRAAPTGGRVAWPLHPQKPDPTTPAAAAPTVEESPPNALQIVTSAELPVTNVPSKRTFNYAAAAAAGTSHEKRPVMPTVSVNNASITQPTAPPVAPVAEEGTTRAEPAPKAENGDVRKKRNRGGRKHRARTDAQRAQQTGEPAGNQGPSAPKETPKAVDPQVAAVTGSSPVKNAPPTTVAADVAPAPRETPSVPTNAWAARAAAKEAEKKQVEPVPVVVANVAPVPNVNPGAKSPQDSMVLQFGSFGIDAMDKVNWSVAEKEVAKVETAGLNAPTPPVAAVPTVPVVPTGIASIAAPSVSMGTAPSAVATPAPTSAVTADGAPASLPRDTMPPSLIPSAALPAASGPVSNGSGIFPVMPPLPQNYPYNVRVMPGYAPYENGTELNNSHNLNMLYDPSALPGMAAGATASKYASMPGLGESNMLSGAPAINNPAKDMLGSAIGDNEKGSTAASAVLPGGMDGLPAPGYLMPQYTYPMYGFSYAQPAMQPGMGPPGPGHFGYAPGGQVTSQAGFGGYPSQTGNMNKFQTAANGARVGFGFDDGNAGLGAGTGRSTGLDLYNRGAYGAMGDHVPKGMNDNSAYKSRSSVPMAAAGLSAPAPVPAAMPYNDYGGPNPVHNAGGLNAAAWNNRPHGSGRSDAGIGNQQAGNSGLPGQSANNGVYGPTTPGPGGYWTNTPYY